MNELQFSKSATFKKFFYWGGARVAFQTPFSFSAALELGYSLQIQLSFGFFIEPFTVFLRGKAGEEHSHTSPANLNSCAILFTLALRVSPSPSGRVVFAGIPYVPHLRDVSLPSGLLLFVSSSTATTVSASLGSSHRCCRVCGLYLSPHWKWQSLFLFCFFFLFLLYDP